MEAWSTTDMRVFGKNRCITEMTSDLSQDSLMFIYTKGLELGHYHYASTLGLFQDIQPGHNFV